MYFSIAVKKIQKTSDKTLYRLWMSPVMFLSRNSGRNAYKANQNHLPISAYPEHPSVSHLSSVDLDLC